MNCQDMRLLLHAYLDDELGAADSLAVARHLAGCADCTQRLRAYTRLRDDVRAAGLYRPAPSALRARIAARWQTVQLRRQGSEALVADAVSDHVRSLLPGHLIDVRTSNEHTVKPWFDGRVDFSPQVKDLSAQGFELVGGRLDVLDGKQVAALVYKRHLHTINLFQWPGNGTAASPPRTRDGYHVLEWNDAGLHFVAVSSVAESDLQVFERAFRAEPGAASETAH